MIKHFTSYFIFSIINAGLTFLISIVLARSLPIEQYGLIGLLLAILYFTKPLSSFNSIGLVSINKIQLNKDKFQIFANNFFIFQFVLMCILYICSLFFILIYPEYKVIILFLPLYGFIFMLSEFHNAELVQTQRSKLYGLYIFYTRTIILIIISIFIYYFHYSWMTYLFSIIIAELLILFIRLKNGFFTLKNFKLDLNNEELKKILIYGLPLLLMLIAGWGLNQSDKFIVNHYFSLKEVAYYTVAYNIGVVINTINQATTNTIVPIIYKALKSNDALYIIKKYTLIYFIIITCIILVISVVINYFIIILYGQEYIQSVNIVILIAIAFGLNGIYRITGMVIEYYKYNILKTSLVTVSMLINILFSVLLISSYGILAPAIGTIIAYMFLAISSQYYGYKILKKKNVK